eukprot:2782313-Rhodomonas_salina.1
MRERNEGRRVASRARDEALFETAAACRVDQLVCLLLGQKVLNKNAASGVTDNGTTDTTSSRRLRGIPQTSIEHMRGSRCSARSCILCPLYTTAAVESTESTGPFPVRHGIPESKSSVLRGTKKG